MESTCFYFQRTLRKLILRKAFWEVRGLNAFCLLSPSDFNLFTSLEQSSFWGQQACRNKGDCRLHGSPREELVQAFMLGAPIESLENTAGAAWAEEESVADPGKSSVCRNLPSSHVCVMRGTFPDNNAILLTIPQGFLRRIIWNYFKIYWVLDKFRG